ncbi:TPA: sodium:alanine symporter family protein [Streptococcus pneumoniae]|nr:Na+/alanine symporter [Streptococcus pneumoniae]HEV9618602.1 sodium:alanine symporter family protein [Streptococcus pneumoniae]HEW4971887.1 sodium:alanine symporter family protein [Streptococcus pneumoniae]HEW5795872.1 sodium:alanine symporter family protein [Streptococcus pneumoniae]HEX0544943.1 sodium:alanine symporter family protein [Streptococcus pneumoniae]
MLELLKSIDDFAWGPPLLILLVGTGVYLTMRLGLLQVLRLPKAFQLIFIQDKGHGDVSSFAALCTALASTVGTGNIIGVATAIKVGGPGALFWMWMAIQNGVARGVFSNESGLGSAPIAAAAAKTNEPVEQGLISMTGTFIDTLIICTLTGLTILVTGVWSGDLNGVALTQSAFSTVFSHFGPALLTIFLVLFAFTTILGWNYYGERCFEFLFGVRFIWLYRVVFVLMVLLGGFIELDMVWIIADIVNALMALPNLIALLVLSPVVIAETKKYFDK